MVTSGDILCVACTETDECYQKIGHTERKNCFNELGV